MADINFLHYIHKNTPLHKLDGRVKLLCLFILMMTIIRLENWLGYVFLASAGLVAIWIAKLPFFAMLKELKILLFILVIIIWFVGWQRAGQLSLVLLFSIITSATTSITTVKNAIQWYLRPIPFIPEARVAMVINLTFVLIPLIIDQYAMLRDAGRARGIELSKNPTRRLKFAIYPLLELAFKRVDELIDAMNSRCYSEVQTAAIFKTRISDWLVLMVCLLLFFFVIMV